MAKMNSTHRFVLREALAAGSEARILRELDYLRARLIEERANVTRVSDAYRPEQKRRVTRLVNDIAGYELALSACLTTLDDVAMAAVIGERF